LLRIKTGFNFAGESINPRLQFVNIAEHFLLRFIRKLPMQIKHFLKAFALIGNILWRVAAAVGIVALSPKEPEMAATVRPA
jgi:hypothetical protein